jgi:hypothetical protein
MTAPKLRIVTAADVERAAEEHLLREAVRMATAVSEAERHNKPMFPTARGRRLLSAATAYLDAVCATSGEPT